VAVRHAMDRVFFLSDSKAANLLWVRRWRGRISLITSMEYCQKLTMFPPRSSLGRCFYL